jgi:hypothetical protein
MILTKPQETKSTVRFSAKLIQPSATGKTGPWTLTLPKSASAKFPPRSSTMVEGTLDGFPFRAALEPDINGSQRIRIQKAVRDAAGAETEHPVMVEITRAGEEPETRVPADLRKALTGSPPARAAWTDITPTARREWILWISSAKLSETRDRRIERACDMLASGKRRVCCFGGLNWLTKDLPNSRDTWRQLPTPTNRVSRRSTK